MVRAEIIRRKILLFAVVLTASMAVSNASAESDDFGLWLSAGAEKRIDKRWSVGIEGEFRTRDNGCTADRWSVGIDGEYKISGWLRASAGYTLLYDNNEGKMTYDSDGSYKHRRPSYWGARHRVAVSLTGRAKAGDFTFSLRERWQYTYRPEKTTSRYDYVDEAWESKTIKGKGRNVLRSRIKIDYDTPGCGIDPYASAEMFNAWSLQKTRYTVGVEYGITKHHTVGLAYIWQDVRDDDDDNDTDSHIISVNYIFKF